jgi:hypothetical protein
MIWQTIDHSPQPGRVAISVGLGTVRSVGEADAIAATVTR